MNNVLQLMFGSLAAGLPIGILFYYVNPQSKFMRIVYPIWTNLIYKVMIGSLAICFVFMIAISILVFGGLWIPSPGLDVVLLIFNIFYTVGCAALGLSIFSFFFPSAIKSALTSLQYERFGRLHRWPAYTSRLLEKHGWVDRVSGVAVTLAQSLPLSPGEKLQLFSPAANVAEHERRIGSAIAEHREVTIFASDMSFVHPEGREDYKGFTLHYRPGLNAWNLASVYKANSFDGMMDFKGFMWHLNTPTKRRNGLELLHVLLKPGGFILFDAHPRKLFKQQFNNAIMANFFGRIFWHPEYSTYSVLEKAFNKDPELSQWFTLEPPIGEGIHRVAVLRKKEIQAAAA